MEAEVYKLWHDGHIGRARDKCGEALPVINEPSIEKPMEVYWRAVCYVALSDGFALLGQSKKAQDLLQQAERIFVPFEPLSSGLQADILVIHGHVSLSEGETLRAEFFLDEALEKLEQAYTKSHPSLRSVLNDCSEVKEKLGKKEEAQQLRQRATEIRQQIEQYRAERDARYRFELPSDVP